MDRIRIGISSCLLGEEVRFDGGHKRDRFLTDTFGRFVEWVAVCPEVEAGFGTPREAMRLVGAGGRLRLLTVKTGVDLTDRMARYAHERVERLARERLSGYVLKKDSPSCGLERVKDNFVERVFAFRRLQELFAGRWTVGGLVRFHTAHKLTLMAHAPRAYPELGRLVARAKRLARPEVERRYTERFMRVLETMATPRRHVNVLQHITGYFKTLLDDDGRAELRATIEEYGAGLVPLIVPITLIRHHVRHHGVAYLAGQVYLEPHPRELMLRNHV